MEVRVPSGSRNPRAARRGLSNRIHLHDSREINALRLSNPFQGRSCLLPGERSADQPESQRLPDILGRIERQTIREALERCGGVQTQAAEVLGISERVLRYKMKKYGLESR